MSEPIKRNGPKFILLNIDTEVAKDIHATWNNVRADTLGRRITVHRSSNWAQFPLPKKIDGLTESDVVVVDFKTPLTSLRPTRDEYLPETETDLWGKCNYGYLDERVRNAISLRQDFERIQDHGGVFIIFADGAIEFETIITRKIYGALEESSGFDTSIWLLTRDTASLTVRQDEGQTIEIDASTPVGKLLAQHTSQASFHCIFQCPALTNGYGWKILARNKFGQAVSVYRRTEDGGLTLILPQIVEKAKFLHDFFDQILPEVRPDWFPDGDRNSWLRRPEYELPKVQELQAELVTVQERCRLEVEQIEHAIRMEKEVGGWIHDLLTGTGDQLVAAVTHALREVGFRLVTDVDEQRDAATQTRREDLRIEDRSPMLIVDIKGISGFPSDEDATQSTKHVLINMREMKRVDLQALTIINHQRHLPPLEREKRLPYREELLTVAHETSTGLMTAFDLYRIVVNKRKHNWSDDSVKDIFYKIGRIDALPAHYQFIGIVAKTYSGMFGVEIQEGAIAVGEKIALDFGGILFEEQSVTSIHVDNCPSTSATIGDRAGFLWNGVGKVREKMKVYAVKSNDK